jgi:hypothetical protein
MMRKRSITTLLSMVAATSYIPSATAQSRDTQNNNVKEQQFLLRARLHEAHLIEFQNAAKRDPQLNSEIRREGLDAAFTDWMRREHPYLFAYSCVQLARQIAADFKSTRHWRDFQALLARRPDMREEAERLGTDAVFADWLRREHPSVYQQRIHALNDDPTTRGAKAASKSDKTQKPPGSSAPHR